MFISEWWIAWLIAPVAGTLVVGAFIAFSASMVRPN